MNRYILLFATLILFSQCATVPITGRKQLNLVPNEEIIPLAEAQYKDVITQGPLSTDKEQVDMIKNVGARIQAAVEQYMNDNGHANELANFNWEFNLIVEDVANAWCMPGGKVAFYTGILPICQDETGVAVVMGHEIAHAIANHGRERMSQQMAVQMGLSSLEVAMGENPTLTKEIFMQSMGIGTQLGMLSFSRQHESESDKIGLIFMAMAGYDPSAAPAFWERMKSMTGGEAPPEWLSTHPSHDTRIADLNAAIPEAMKYYKPSK